MPFLPLPLALLEGIGTLVAIVFWVIYQVYSASQKEEPKPLRPPEPLPEDEFEGQGEGRVIQAGAGQPRAGQAGGGQAGAGQGDLRSEVELFLEKLQQQQAGEQPVKQARAEAPVRRGPIDPFEEPPRRQPPPSVEYVDVEVVPERQAPTQPRREPTQRKQSAPRPKPKKTKQPTRRVGDLSQQHLPESQLAEQAAQLGDQIAQSDERLEARLHEKFDHKLGKLRSGETTSTTHKQEASDSAAARIAAMLASPGGVRDAVVLGEILNRPTDRW